MSTVIISELVGRPCSVVIWHSTSALALQHATDLFVLVGQMKSMFGETMLAAG